MLFKYDIEQDTILSFGTVHTKSSKLFYCKCIERKPAILERTFIEYRNSYLCTCIFFDLGYYISNMFKCTLGECFLCCFGYLMFRHYSFIVRLSIVSFLPNVLLALGKSIV